MWGSSNKIHFFFDLLIQHLQTKILILDFNLSLKVMIQHS